uniref:L1 transposable element RRM domain-containing protein n=1 Tax=Pipistrellus kuhlii TaxID=59472 RepID=A0A7J7VVL0_PIPKU|nr:hypothetical protein mPipKuh1_008329 [Pipistrellus kuhlii]
MPPPTPLPTELNPNTRLIGGEHRLFGSRRKSRAPFSQRRRQRALKDPHRAGLTEAKAAGSTLKPRPICNCEMRQQNRSQTKEMEDKKRLDIEFKSTLIRFFKNFLEKMDKAYEDMKRDQLELIRRQQEMIRDQQEIKNTLSEIKNILQSPKNRREDHKNQVKDLEHKEPEDTPPQKLEGKRIQKIEDNVRNLWDNFKQTNIRIIGVPEDEREQDIENILKEIVTENFPHLVKELDLQVQEAHRTPNKRNPKRTTPRHIIIKIPRAKDKERILKEARAKKVVTYKGAPI